VQVRLNGEPRELSAGTTVLGLLEDLKVHPLRVAVQVNLDIVRRERYEETELRPGDQIEILTFMAGG
jgi:thiamine biosynthesis protein ThiS